MTDKIDISAEAVAAIMEDVTKGRPVQFHPEYCEEAKDAPSSSWDTSHDLSVISEDGSGYRVATFRHASDAMFDQWAREAVPALSARLAEAEAKLAQVDAPAWIENCIRCGRIVDTREMSDGGDPHGCEYDQGWVCSRECANALLDTPVPATPDAPIRAVLEIVDAHIQGVVLIIPPEGVGQRDAASSIRGQIRTCIRALRDDPEAIAEILQSASKEKTNDV